MTLDEWAVAIGDAALKIAPLSGSEAFIEVRGRYRVDPDFIAQRAEELKRQLHEARIQIARLKRNAL